MELLEDEDTKNTYNECKYKVKLWEHEFKKKHKRLPCKLDIREASAGVRNAYKIYFRLKTAALEESLMNLDGFDSDAATDHVINASEDNINIDLENVQSTSGQHAVDEKTNTNANNTWGFHLNKTFSSGSDSKSTEAKSNINKSLSQKLFKGSKSSKRLPRKSLSFVRKKSNSNQKQQFLSQSETSASNDNLISSQIDCTKLLNSCKITTPVVNVRSQSINLLSGNNNLKPLRQLDPGWIERLGRSTQIDTGNKNDIDENAELDYDSDDVIANSEDELDNSCQRVTKKPKIASEAQNVLNSCSTSNVEPVRLDFRNIFNKSSTVEPVVVLEKLTDDKVQRIAKDFGGSVNLDEDSNSCLRTVSKPRNCNSQDYNFVLSDTENDDPFHTDDDTNDPEFTLSGGKSNHTQCLDEVNSPKKVNKSKIIKDKKVQKKSKKEKAGHKSVPETDVTNEIYELEYSVKPRTVRAPRVKNIKQILYKNENEVVTTKCDQVSNREQQLLAKLEQKVNSGTLNDNYVQINLKKKIYVRGKRTNTFAKFKKQQWKDKRRALYGPDMDMGGCDGGTLNCFNCGEKGHFARACPRGKLDTLLPLNDYEELCSYPTLEEAAKMAQDSPLVVRKPNQVGEGNEKQANPEVDKSDNNDDDPFSDEYDDELLAETQRLEEEIKKIDVQKYIDLTSFVRPYYQANDDGSLIDTPAEVFEALNKFGYNNFRAGQEQAIMRILSGKSTLVTLSTGSGKSLCYQLPAYLYSKREPCISLIISPLVSLMEDQVLGIPKFLNASCLHNNQSKIQKDKIIEAIKSGNLNVLLVSPEAVVAGEKSSGFGSLLRKLPPIAFACIDEAHCVSQWSHNFRPSYLKICRVLRDRLGVKTILGLTATATRATCDSIINHFNISDGTDGIIQDIPLPDNLKLTISCDAQKDQALLSLILSERYTECQSIIVYCTRREECQRVATFLRTSLKYNGLVADNKKRKRVSLLAEPYHAGLSASRRKTIQKAFMSGELRIVVATVAFGMGINKSDLRSVIHYNMPMSFESYVQEVGRAGRDGLPAYCHLFLNSQGNDENELLRHVYANSTDRHVIRKLLQRCFIPCSCKSSCPRHEVAFSIQDTVQALDVPEENIETLLCYLELHEKHYIELLSNAYVTCKIICYGSANIIHKAAKDCPPLAMALAMFRKKDDQRNVFEFPIVDVASAMGWDSGICKHILKNLEWITVNGCPQRSQIGVQYLNLGFRLLSPGNLSDSELDEALDNLHERVKEQERTSVLQLHAIHSSLSTVAASTYKNCCSSNIENNETENSLKLKIREYFASSKPLDFVPEIPVKAINEEVIISDVRSLICMYRDNTFTGRSVARIFHGIQSPNYPALIWGRCKFWRSHLGEDFNAIVQIATKEILRMR